MSEETEPFCYTCISSAYWQECDECDDGWVERDWDVFYERCQTCNGAGGWWVCLGSERHDLGADSIHRIPLDERVSGKADDNPPA